MTKKPDVSVIILNYNAEKFLRETLKSVEMQKGVVVETIVVDNNSSDGSKAMVKKEFPSVRWVQRDTSLGFSAGNNAGLPFVHSDAVLFLNPDASFTKSDDLKKCLAKLWSDDTIGTLTARVNLVLTGGIDVTCHRGFPTPWASFTHFVGLSKLFPDTPLFNQYTKNYLGYDTEHEIDAVGGMFMLMRTSVGKQVGWWDEDYPLYGEDIDFCYRLKESGYRNLYWPKVKCPLQRGHNRYVQEVAQSLQPKGYDTSKAGQSAMEIFYAKHYAKKYPFFINWLVYLRIKLAKFRRVTLA
jgi:hypothetical protein